MRTPMKQVYIHLWLLWSPLVICVFYVVLLQIGSDKPASTTIIWYGQPSPPHKKWVGGHSAEVASWFSQQFADAGYVIVLRPCRGSSREFFWGISSRVSMQFRTIISPGIRDLVGFSSAKCLLMVIKHKWLLSCWSKHTLESSVSSCCNEWGFIHSEAQVSRYRH